MMSLTSRCCFANSSGATFAQAVVTAIEADRPHLRLTRRAAPVAAVTGAPRALARMALTGIPARPGTHDSSAQAPA